MGNPEYRRRIDRLKWHTNSQCPKWPKKEYVEDRPVGPMAGLMVCPTCKKLDAKRDKKS